MRWAVQFVLAGVLAGALSLGPARARPATEEGVICAPPEAALPSGTAAGGVIAASTSLPYRVVIPDLTRASMRTAPPPTSPSLLGLEARLEGVIAGTSVSGRFAVAVEDLQTGERIGVNAGRAQLSGCVMNFFVILAALRDVEQGAYALESVDGVIRQTIWASDATAARSLYGIVGGGDVVAGVGRVDELQRMIIGLTVTSIDHPPAFPDESLNKHTDNWTTAGELTEVMGLLYRGELLGGGLTAWLMEAMTHVKPGLNYLTAALPAGATVSHKNGFFPNWDGFVDNDTAIVRFGDDLQYAYAITFLSEAVPTLYADIPLAQRLVAETWAHFAETYR